METIIFIVFMLFAFRFYKKYLLPEMGKETCVKDLTIKKLEKEIELLELQISDKLYDKS